MNDIYKHQESGWAQAIGKARKYHYFDYLTRSICGKGHIGFLDTANHNPPDKKKCRNCLKLLPPEDHATPRR